MPRISRGHALSAYEPILTFANSKVTDENYFDLVFGVVPKSRRKGIEVGVLGKISDASVLRVDGKEARSPFPIPFEVVKAIRSGEFTPKTGDTVESVLRGCYKLAGRRVERETVATLRDGIRLALERFLAGRQDLVPPADFKVRSRAPLEHPKVTRADDGAFDPDTNDLLDLWYGYVSSLVAALVEAQPLVVNRDGRRRTFPFRPLKNCPGCKKFFFSPGGPRQVSCGLRPCVDRLAHGRAEKPRRTRARTT